MTTAPPLTEAAFMAQVTEYAELRNWEWVHCRAGRTVDSWRTPMSGTMARGFPDLVLVREYDRRLIFAELKRDAGKVTADQERVLDVLDRLDDDSEGSCGNHKSRADALSARCHECPTWISVHVWRPMDWAAIEATLR